MPRGVAKSQLPSKTCLVCQLPFTWRKKWEQCWDEVTTCSKSCNGKRKAWHRTHTAQLRDEQKLALRAASTGTDAAASDGGRAHTADEVDTGGIAAAVGNLNLSNGGTVVPVPPGDCKTQRKAARQAAKAERRRLREGTADVSVGRKPCDLCSTAVDVLIRCRTDASQVWSLVCDQCWPRVSGGVTDGDLAHPHYRYGGLWRNRHVRQGPRATAAPGVE